MAKNDKNQIDFILGHLRNGLNRKDILPQFTKKYPFGADTFKNRLRDAKVIYDAELKKEAELNQKKEKIREALLPEHVKAEIEANIATELELDMILSRMARGEVDVESWMKGQRVITPIDPQDQLSAIDKLYKRKGSYASIKLEDTTPNKKQTITLSNGTTIELS